MPPKRYPKVRWCRSSISHHLDLYRYWITKRAGRSMPARRDLNPADIPNLLPSLIIVDKVDDQFRYRLVGTAAAREIGRDPTGSILASYASTPESGAAARAIHERVFTTARSVFVSGEFKVTSGAIVNMSLLTVPLSDDGTDVNMAVSALVVRFNFDVAASSGWLTGAQIKVDDVIDVHDAAELEEHCLDWERHCDDQRRRPEGLAEREQ
jgi:hypothetical protein